MTWQLHSASEFGNYREQWDELNLRGSNSPVLNAAFIIHSLEELASGKEMLAVHKEAGAIDAMAVLRKSKFGVWDTFQPSQAPLGAWINNSDNDLQDLLKSLSSALPGIVLKLGLTQQDPAIYPRPADQGPISTMDYIETASVDTTGTFDDYWASRGKNLRHNLKRQRNRLKKEGVEPSLKTIRDPEQVRAAVEAYGKLESAGWKGQEGTAIEINNPQGKFYVALLEDFCNKEQGCIYQYFYNDDLVASDLCIEQAGVLVILKTTYNESISTSSPAFLMRQDSFQEIFDSERIKTIEFYGKMMEWHTKWSHDSRIIYHLNLKKF
ncbi:GNAT family N-acetyltransferase [Sedimenticola thiotaurini]|uniref:BioF2-like acetyltransferase domain-containing protein n=1 Tax=Sedimenticola thiotaurini TaxID=1543721 RepID=A0A0F7JYI5_9GAMM|nr:GNAT family N-acetyltransferase [Sedimenticola thiotaurini]AKH19703.1 hypothetical protein AAY24_04270 [Sedimenticola thiotaurini]